MNRRPLLAFTALWVIGSGAASMLSGSRLIFMLAGLLLLLLVLGCLVKAGRGMMLCMALSLCAAALYWELHDATNVSYLSHIVASDEDGISITATGTIVSPVEVDGDRADFRVMLGDVDIASERGERLSEMDDQLRTSLGEEGEHSSFGTPSTISVKEEVIVQVRLLSMEEVQVAQSWQRGDEIRLQGELQRPGEARNFDGFDYRRYLRTEKIHWIIKVKGVDQADVTVPIQWRPAHLLRWNDSLRQTLGDRLEQLYEGVYAGFMKGLIIGNRDDLDPETFREFSRLGLTHILAISGMHVAVVTGCLLFILSAMKLTRESSLTIAMWLLPLYVLLTGASPSVVRAGIMGVIGLYAARRKMLKDGLNILSAAAFLMLLWNPYYLINVSFQLSFIVTAGLMIFVPMMVRLLTRLPMWLAGSVGVTVVAQLVSFPLTIYYFNQFSLLSVVANLFLVPVISMVVLPLGMVSLFLGWVWMMGAGWVASVAEWIIMITLKVVSWMNGSLRFMTIWPSPSLVWIIFYFVLLYGLFYLLKKRAEDLMPDSNRSDDTVPLFESGGRGKVPARISMHNLSGAGLPLFMGRLISKLTFGGFSAAGRFLERYGYRILITCCAGGLLLLLYDGYQPPATNGAGIVQFLDVGQGDSILVTTPEGKFILIDGGGTVSFRKKNETWKERKDPFEVGKKVVVPLLKKRGVHQLEAVIATHFDQDHVGGLVAVTEEIPVKSLWINGSYTDSKAFTSLMQSAITKNIPVYKGGAESEAWNIDKDTEIRFLDPSLSEGNKYMNTLPLIKEQNHASLVFELRMSGGRFLFTGDTDVAAEQKILLQQEEQARLDGRESVMADYSVDVMKVAHHGSKTSTSDSWLNTWRPKVSVISAGVNNMYGHPHPDVVKRLERSGTLIYQTNLHGEIQLKIKNNAFEARTKLKPNQS